ncbi:SpoIIE family protein phosphatase [Streptomyces sp. NPDC002490]|uniref:SpoIIE family protein phosphatase n=1 Tax=Streptomyces sp. NPDC002490 TaxID=3154416 RepID=UPI00332CCE97
MVERAARDPSLPDDWPAGPAAILSFNRVGSFDWDLDRGLMHLDRTAHQLLDLDPDTFDGRPASLSGRIPPIDAQRLDSRVAQAMKDGSAGYAAAFRIRHRDGLLHWVRTHARFLRDPTGRPRRIVGILRDAPETGDGPANRRTSIVQVATDALAHARTVQDVIDVLKDTRGLTHLGATSLVLGLVEAGRIRLVADGPAGSFVPATRVTRVDEPYPMSEVVRTLTPRFIESAEEFAASYPVLWPHLTDLEITSAAYLPLIAQARPIGALGLLYHDRYGFTEEERDILVALSSSIAQGLRRAMFYEQEKDLATGLQRAMLPRTIPAVPGADLAVRYRSASLGRDVGGDWYDVIPLPGGRVGAVIGDVQGHDTHAAAVMGQLRIVLRAYAAEGHNPATVMARASVFLHELDTERFATCLYAEADLSTGVVQLVRAGHLDPLLRSTDGTCRRLPVEGGLPLGLSAEFGRLAYAVTTVELDPGQTLILCTDGLVETPGADLDDGLMALTGLVEDGPRDLQLLADRLCATADDRGGDDDVALLLLRRLGVGAAQSGGRLQQRVPPGDPGALREARRMIRSAVAAWGAADRADEIELVADELITNALIHTEGPTTVTLRVLSGAERRFRIEVDDPSSALPRRRDAGAEDASGRGLLLVDRLADVWGVESRGGGKSVWTEFAVPGRTPPPSPGAAAGSV